MSHVQELPPRLCYSPALRKGHQGAPAGSGFYGRGKHTSAQQVSLPRANRTLGSPGTLKIRLGRNISDERVEGCRGVEGTEDRGTRRAQKAAEASTSSHGPHGDNR